MNLHRDMRSHTEKYPQCDVKVNVYLFSKVIPCPIFRLSIVQRTQEEQKDPRFWCALILIPTQVSEFNVSGTLIEDSVEAIHLEAKEIVSTNN